MASQYNWVANKTTIAFGTSAFVAKIKSINGRPLTRADVDVTNLNSVGTTDTANVYREFQPGSIDPGTCTLEIGFDPDASPPINAAKETITITWPNGATWACSGYINNYDPQGELDGHLVASITIKFSGEPTFTASS